MELMINNLKKRYSSFTLEANFRCADNEILVIVGPSGCGKTTALRLIAGLEPADSGQISYDDIDLAKLPTWERKCGLVFQEAALFPHLSVGANVAYGPFIAGVKRTERRRLVHYYLKLVKLESYLKRAVHTLSGGERQRVALARALAAEPRILLMDEPFASLDGPLRRRLWDEFLDVKHRLSFPCLFVTHDRDEAARIGDRVALMRDGRVVETGTMMDTLLRPKTAFAAHFFGLGNIFPLKKYTRQGKKLSFCIGPTQFSVIADDTLVNPALLISLDALYPAPSSEANSVFHGIVISYRLSGLDLIVSVKTTEGALLRFRRNVSDDLPVKGESLSLSVNQKLLCIVETDLSSHENADKNLG